MEAKELARKLAELLENPKPGLSTWHIAVGNTWNALKREMDDPVRKLSKRDKETARVIEQSFSSREEAEKAFADLFPEK